MSSPASDAPGTSYAIVPSLRRPRFLVPARPGAAVALRPSKGGLSGLGLQAVSTLQRWSVLHRLSRSHLHVVDGPAGAGIDDVLTSVLGDVSYLVVRLGRPRAHRTLVVWAFDSHDVPVAIAKVARGAPSQEALETEFAALATAPAAGVPGLVAPSVLGYVRWRGSDVLVISALTAPDARPSHLPALAQMRALAASAGGRDEPLHATAFVSRLTSGIAALVGDDDRVWLGDALGRMLADLGGTVVRTGASHGDWVSWNQVVLGDDVLLWDWEHYSTAALAGFDHVHFLAQEQRDRGTDARAEDTWMVRADRALAEGWAMSADQRRAVLRAYLLEVNLRFVRDRQHEDGAPTRAGWSRLLLERLAGAPGS